MFPSYNNNTCRTAADKSVMTTVASTADTVGRYVIGPKNGHAFILEPHTPISKKVCGGLSSLATLRSAVPLFITKVPLFLR